METTIETKQCRKCGEIKELSEFYKNRRKCKLCICAFTASYYANNKEKK